MIDTNPERRMKNAAAAVYGVALGLTLLAIAMAATAPSRAKVMAEKHLKLLVTAPSLEELDGTDPFCEGARYCFRYRGIDTMGQLQTGLIRSL